MSIITCCEYVISSQVFLCREKDAKNIPSVMKVEHERIFTTWNQNERDLLISEMVSSYLQFIIKVMHEIAF